MTRRNAYLYLTPDRDLYMADAKRDPADVFYGFGVYDDVLCRFVDDEGESYLISPDGGAEEIFR